MKKIIGALVLVLALSVPVWAGGRGGIDVDDDSNIAAFTNQSAVAQDGSIAIDGNVNLSKSYTKNIDKSISDSFKVRYDNDNNVIAISEMKQINTVGDDIKISAGCKAEYEPQLKVIGSIDEFSGIANANLNAGIMNNQAIQNTFGVKVSIKEGCCW